MGTGILLVGGGKMGEALVAGWRQRGLQTAAVTVVEPDVKRRGSAAFAGLTAVESPDRIPPAVRPEIVVFAVKPQVMADALPAYRRFAGGDAVFLSIAAGRTLAFLERYLGGDAAVVRAMPNTPAAVQAAITVACANGVVTDRQRALCDRVLAAVGEVAWIDDEGLMDAVTAVSGSGPAYVFLLTEALAEGGVAAGLPPALAARLARSTVVGAGALLKSGDEAPADLRRNVTSPGGTTEAALRVLMADGGLPDRVTEAVRVATARSRALAG